MKWINKGDWGIFQIYTWTIVDLSGGSEALLGGQKVD